MASCVNNGCVSRCPRYPGGEPINFAISCECWNSAQSIFITEFESPKRTSAAASTTLFLPDYPCAQPVLKFLCPGTLAVRVERYQLPFLTVANHFPNLLSAPLCSP